MRRVHLIYTLIFSHLADDFIQNYLQMMTIRINKSLSIYITYLKQTEQKKNRVLELADIINNKDASSHGGSVNMTVFINEVFCVESESDRCARLYSVKPDAFLKVEILIK